MKESQANPKNPEVPQHMILGMRMLIAWKEQGTIPLRELETGSTQEDEKFMHMVLSYYSQIKNDDFALWTNEQVSYYTKHGLPYEPT